MKWRDAWPGRLQGSLYRDGLGETGLGVTEGPTCPPEITCPMCDSGVSFHQQCDLMGVSTVAAVSQSHIPAR